jgi:hypothetical protein
VDPSLAGHCSGDPVKGVQIVVGIEVMATVFMLTVPFGFYRAFTRKLSAPWFGAIHLPVPFIFLVRMGAGLPYTFIPFTCLAFATAQLLGGRVGAWWARRSPARAGAIVYPRRLLISAGLTVLAALTLMPVAHGAANLLGYRSLCSFAPVSSSLLIMVAGVNCVMRAQLRRGKAPATCEVLQLDRT